MINKTIINGLSYLPIILVLLLTEIFTPGDPMVETSGNFGLIKNTLIKTIPLICFAYTTFNWFRLSLSQRTIYLFFVVGFVYLVFESLYISNSFFVYPHVFLKWLNAFVAFAFYFFYKDKEDINWGFIMNLVLIALLVKVALNPHILAMDLFVAHKRPLSSYTALLIMLPCLYFFNQYMVDLRSISLIKFLILLFFIVYLQHRSVWSALVGAFLFNIYFIKDIFLSRIKQIFSRVVLLTVIVGFVGTTILTYFPSISEKINREVENIMNPAEDNTGNWRLQQMESYWPFVKDNIVSGMKLRGFELPNQFYFSDDGGESDSTVFDDNTGHHFHSFYLDISFYFGALGIVAFLWLILIPIFRGINIKRSVTALEISLVSFVFGGIIYGFAYNINFEYWMFLGVAYAVVEQKSREVKAF